MSPATHHLELIEVPPPQTATVFPILDSLRAVGALAVLTTHVAFWAGDYSRHGAWGTLLARLDVGVAIFFVLSGFLLSRAYLVRAADGLPAPRTGRYLWKRFLRIAPVYVIAVTLALLFIDANADLPVGGWVRTLLMVETFHSPAFPPGLTQMWSLAVEVSFYLVLPALMLAATGRRFRPGRVVLLLVAMAAISVWWHLAGAGWAGSWSPGAPLDWLPAFLLWFALGIGLALLQVLHERGVWHRITAPVVAMAHQPGSCWAVVLGLMLVAATPLAGPSMLAPATPGQSLTKNVVYGLIGLLVVVTGVFSQPGGTYARFFSHPVARHLGWTSYAVFCLHLGILHGVMWATGWELFAGRGLEIWLLTVVLSIVAADLVYRLVERPALRLKGLGQRPRSAAKSPTSGTSTT